MTKNIVIIDDEPAFSELLKTMIENQGDYTVVTFESPSKALNHIVSQKPDAVFVDMLMPENDGGSVIKSIKIKLTTAPFLVLVTGMVSEDEISNLPSPILAKPVNPESLVSILKQIAK